MKHRLECNSCEAVFEVTKPDWVVGEFVVEYCPNCGSIDIEVEQEEDFDGSV